MFGGNSRYNSQPGENVIISENKIHGQETAVYLNGTTNVTIANNIVTLDSPTPRVELVKRSEHLKSDLNAEHSAK